ncbi:MAG: class I SAM-dependent methyltransferase [Fermentimonas sp.]
MIESSFTDKAHWEEYWQNYMHGNLPEKVVFSPFVPRLKEGKSFIEIGGFPGSHAAYFYRQGVRDVSILDFYIDREIVRKLEEANGLPADTIQCIESDFFAFTTEKRYDIVFSSGFIEHFEDTEAVIQRHVELLSEHGQLLILLPNFLGLNGKVQQWFDKANLNAHNLRSMEIPRLKEIMQLTGLREISVDYIGKPMVCGSSPNLKTGERGGG